MQKRKSFVSAGVGATFLLAGSAFAGGPVYTDNFDSYTVGGGVVGMNGWEFWDGGFDDAVVSDDFANSGSNSMQVVLFTDVVQDDMDFTTGTHEHRCFTYVPTGNTGANYLIALNQYTGSGDAANNWSLQVLFNADTNMVVAEGGGAESTPLIRDTWVEVVVTIDLDADTHDISYGGTQFVTDRTWSGGVSGGGIQRITCFDYFSNGSNEGLYFDDVEFGPVGGGPVAGTLTSAVITFGIDQDGGGVVVANLNNDDNVVEQYRSLPGISALEPDFVEVRYNGTTGGTSMHSVLSRENANAVNAVGKVKAFNYNTNQLVDVGQYGMAFGNGAGNDVESVVNVGGTQYVSGGGDFRVHIRFVAPAVFSALGMDVWQDQFVAFFE